MNRCLANSHTFVPLGALTVRTSVYTYIAHNYIYIYIYIYLIADRFVYEPVWFKLTYVYALASAHTQNLLIYLHILTSIQISYRRCVCRCTHVEKAHICLCPCECSHLEPLDIHAYTHKYTYIISQIRLQMNPCCAKSHMCALASAHTQNLLRYMHIFTSIHISYRRYVCR